MDVEDGGARAEGEGRDGGGGGAPDAGKLGDAGLGGGKSQLRNVPGGGVQVAGAGVIAQARP